MNLDSHKMLIPWSQALVGIHGLFSLGLIFKSSQEALLKPSVRTLDLSEDPTEKQEQSPHSGETDNLNWKIHQAQNPEPQNREPLKKSRYHFVPKGRNHRP